MVKVFLSSTSRDLGAYRQKALEICQRFDLQPIAMEYFEAMSAGATEGSLRKVDASDLYVGIFAHRYGYIEEGHQNGVTELEFDRAVEMGIDRLCFVVDPSYPWPPEAIDYEKWEKLQLFKRRIDKYHIRSLFTTVDDFAVKLTQALVKWQQHKGLYTTLNPQAQPDRIILAPPRPGLLIGREYDLETIKTYLRKGRSGSQITIVRGWPGVGKTTLITSLAYDETLTHDFPDGVLWASVGQEPNLFAELKLWAAALGVDQPGQTLDDVVRTLKRLLASKRLLLIADDVWSTEHAAYFRSMIGPQCALLVTTREDEIARNLAETREDSIYYLKQLTDDQALDLLRRLAPSVVARFPDESLRLMQDLEGLPLAIRVVGRLLDNEGRLRDDIRDVFEEFHHGRLIDDVVVDRGITLDTVIAQSTRRLEPDMRFRYAMLGAFAPKPATFDLNAMQFLWEVDNPMPTIRALTDRGLLEPLPSIGRYQMHAVLVMHAQKLLNNEAALTAPALQIGTASGSTLHKPLNPLVDANTPEPYKGMYLKELTFKIKTLQRRRLKGEPVDKDIDHIRGEIERLGGDPDRV